MYRVVFAHFGYRGDQGESWETLYEKLARMAKPEDWDFHRGQFRRPGHAYPVLTSYLNYTFLRLQELGGIAYSADDSRACFNAGLQTPNEKDIFATFLRYKPAAEKDQPAWTLFGFFDSYSERLSDLDSSEEFVGKLRFGQFAE